MTRFRVSKQAQIDLDGIWDFIAEDNPDAADRFIGRIFEKFPALAGFPELGRRCEQLAAALRVFPVGNYLIFYRPFGGGVEIVRIIHGARDLESLLEDLGDV